VQAGVDGEFDEYLALFGGPLSESKRETIKTLFPAGLCDRWHPVEGVELEV
jgi:hypothetical protein